MPGTSDALQRMECIIRCVTGKGGKGGPKPKPQLKRPSEEEAEQENKKPKKEEILEKLKALQGGSGGALMEDDDDEPLDEDAADE